MLKKSKVLVVLVTVMCLLVLTVGCSTPEETAPPDSGTPSEDVKPIDLKLITSWAKGNVNYVKGEKYCEVINELSEGRLNLKIAGGTEAFAQTETVEAVSKGTMDGAYSATDYYSGYVPEGSVLSVTKKTMPELQDNGGFSYLQDLYKNHNLMLVNVEDMQTYLGFHIWTKEPIKGLDDIKGMKFRTSPGPLSDTMKALGAEVVTMPLGDVFSALEQGLIDGYCVPSMIGAKEGFFEYTAMRVDPPVFGGGSGVVFNLDSWNKIPADLQELILSPETNAAVNAAMKEVGQGVIDENFKAFEESGGVVLNLSDADKAKLDAIVKDLSTKYVEANAPEEAAELIKYFF